VNAFLLKLDVTSTIKKSERFYDECANLMMQLKDSATEKNRLQQKVLELQQQLKDQERAHKKEVDELKALHKVESNKQNKLYQSQQKRYNTMLSSTGDYAKNMALETRERSMN
jgi:hypothetical protein